MNFLKKNFIYILLLIILGIFALVPGAKNLIFPIAAVEESVSISKEDYDIDLKGINTPDTNLKNFNKKVLFLNFWGTWCAPCRKEWPSVQKLYEARKNDVDFVLIAMQDQEDEVIQFLKENQYTAPVYIAQSPISEKLLPKVFPTTYILNRKGLILQKETSSKDWNTKSTYDFLDQMTR